MAGDVCGSCGIEAVDGAQYCHACGRRLHGAPIDFDIYGDDRPEVRSDGPEPARQSTRTMLVGLSVVILVVVIGLAVFDWFSTSDAPSAEPSPSTTVALDRAEPTSSPPDSTGVGASGIVLNTDGSLAWHEGPDIGGLTPRAIVEYDGQVFVFATPPGRSLHLIGAGVDMWRTGDGVAWQPEGTVIDSPNLVTSVRADPDGLVAVGQNADGDPAMWRSVDGSSWAMTALPESPLSSVAAVPFMSASAGDVEVIVGRPNYQDPLDLLLTAMQELTGLSLDEFNVSAQFGGSLEAIISGPFDLPLFSASGEELGLSPEDVRRITNGDTDRPSPTSTVWSTTDGLDWQVTILDQVSPWGLVVNNDGRFMMSGNGPQGLATWGSDLGESWQQLDSGQNAASPMVPWEEMFIGTQGFVGGDIATSTDGSDWKPIGLPDILSPSLRLGGSRLAAGDEGIAATVYTTATGTAAPTDLPEVILVKDGYTLTANYGGGADNLALRRGQDTLITTYLDSDIQAGIVADLGNETVTFIDPQTSDPYVTFTIDELRQLDTTANKGRQIVGRQSLIIFSPDATTWTITDIIGPSTSGNVSGLQVTSHGLIAAITTQPATPSAPPNASTTQIFIADYPS